jgi:multidrug efflux system membrane fusion protein
MGPAYPAIVGYMDPGNRATHIQGGPRFGYNLIRVLLLVSLLLNGCSGDKRGEPGTPRTIPVVAAAAVRKNVPVQIRAIGNVHAYSTVSVKSMVGGEIVKVFFSEGRSVNKGDPLFTIDPRPFEAAVKQADAVMNKDLAQVKQAEANLAKDHALLKLSRANLERDLAEAKNAEVDAQRYKELFEKKMVSEQQYYQLRTSAEALNSAVRADRAAIDSAQAAIRASADAVENAKASVQADRAALENANIELGYCFIRAPIDGVTGNLLVQAGNIIKANDTPYLVVINQIHPIYVVFSVPEENLPEIQKYMAFGKLTVEAIIPNDPEAPEPGMLSFVDNAVDSTTGTIQLSGTSSRPRESDRQCGKRQGCQLARQYACGHPGDPAAAGDKHSGGGRLDKGVDPSIPIAHSGIGQPRHSL